ncbi:hypothetical protein V1523DRAFT_421034, partial [Lipomyces doorenjongii]
MNKEVRNRTPISVGSNVPRSCFLYSFFSFFFFFTHFVNPLDPSGSHVTIQNFCHYDTARRRHVFDKRWIALSNSRPVKTHRGLPKVYSCDAPQCRKRFTRQEHLKKHGLNH